MLNTRLNIAIKIIRNVNCIEMLNLPPFCRDYCALFEKHLHSAWWYMRDCSKDNSIPDMMCNEIRYLAVTSVTSSARWRLLQSVRIPSWVEIDFAIALIAPRSIEYSPLFRTRIYQTDRDAREEAEYEKSPLVNHRVTLCVYSCTSRLTGVTYFFFLLRTCVTRTRDENKKASRTWPEMYIFFITRRYFSWRYIFDETFT